MFVSLNQPLLAHPLIKDKHPFKCDMRIGLFNRIAIVIRPVRLAQNHVSGCDVVLLRRVSIGIEPTNLPNVVLEFTRRITDDLGGFRDRHRTVIGNNLITVFHLGFVLLNLFLQLLVVINLISQLAKRFRV